MAKSNKDLYEKVYPAWVAREKKLPFAMVFFELSYLFIAHLNDLPTKTNKPTILASVFSFVKQVSFDFSFTFRNSVLVFVFIVSAG